MYKFASLFLTALAVAGSAQAATTITSTNGPDVLALPAGQTVLYDFESGTPAGLTGNFAIVSGSVPNVYAAPLGDTTNYLSVPINGSSGSATLVLQAALKSVSFYWGSIDDYNTVEFFNAGGTSLGAFTGAQIPPAPADGSQANFVNNRRVNFSFGDQSATRLTFTSSQNAFEIDNIAGAGAVPEPATWAMLVFGMGLVGTSMRRRRTTSVVTA